MCLDHRVHLVIMGHQARVYETRVGWEGMQCDMIGQQVELNWHGYYFPVVIGKRETTSVSHGSAIVSEREHVRG